MLALSAPLAGFHPAIQAWFSSRFREPTPAQARGWPPIQDRRDTLIVAPTGGGKTLAAFLACIDRLLQEAEAGLLHDQVQVVYVSPLKALGNDIHRNLEAPLAEILGSAAAGLGRSLPEIRVALRTGDTTAKEREAMIRLPPHILITTPESLYLLLTAGRGREMLRQARTVIVDEIHALARDKRGSHLSLSLARLDALCAERPVRIGLSATQRPVEAIARFLVGASRSRSDGSPDCEVVDTGYQRDLDLGIEAPPTDLEAVASGQQWNDVFDRLADLAREHHTTLVFVNTRRLAERVAFQLGQRLGEAAVGAHHGSLAKERRLEVEQRLKAGQMQVLVATASLELGIDIGSVQLVCQIGSPRSISTFLQRVGRSGHSLGLVPKGRLFALTRDELVECAALVRAVRLGRLDAIHPPEAPLDILAQQVVAETAAATWDEHELFRSVRQAAPYSALAEADYEQVVEMLSDGFARNLGRGRTYLQRDRLAGTLKGRRGARLAALTSGGAIPEVADYRVVAEPEGALVGTVNEDFAIESMSGDIFLLGATAWRIKRVEMGTVRVEDAHGAPPTIPFWTGEAPARSLELSQEVSSLRRELATRLDGGTGDRGQGSDGDGVAQKRLSRDSPPHAESVGWLVVECGLDRYAAEQLVRYVRATRDSLGVVPSDTDVVFERFFDESGGMQLVVHAPFGGRINRAWALALRKRFCVTFDQELQAAATDDAFLLSLGPQHSFPLKDTFGFIRPETLRETLVQAMLPAPMFRTRWRWNATRALAVLRQRGGRKVPPQIQRMQADDLLAAVFPAAAACQENVAYPIELPDHPLVRQTVQDCLHEAMDLDGLLGVLRQAQSGQIRLHARDTTEPSPMAHEVLGARPYAYLDDAPLEERRARAVSLRRVLPEHARELGTLDSAAIQRVRDEASPQPRDAEETLDALLGLGAVSASDVAGWEAWLEELRERGRAIRLEAGPEAIMWVASQQVAEVSALYEGSNLLDPVPLLARAVSRQAERDETLLAVLRGHLESLGPTSVLHLARRLKLPETDVLAGLARLEHEGFVLRGRFTPSGHEEEFCERRLLARIHRYTMDRLRQEIEPVSTQDFLRFLLRWQHVAPGTQLEGKRGAREAALQLQGFEAPAASWERDLLPARVRQYKPGWLDELCLSGELGWGRLSLPARGGAEANGRRASAGRGAMPITLAQRSELPSLMGAVRGEAAWTKTPEPLAGAAAEVLAELRARGALFQSDLVARCRRLPADIEAALAELVGVGLVASDGFQALRRLIGRSSASGHRLLHRGVRARGVEVPGGRWGLMERSGDAPPLEAMAEKVAGVLLARYGVLFRDLLTRERFQVPWRELVRVLRRQEAQGLVRGGRFVAGVFGEQYALAGAVESLRAVRRLQKKGEVVRVSAADPLNLVGVLTPGARTPSLQTNLVFFRDGLPVATREGGRLIIRAEGGEAAMREAATSGHAGPPALRRSRL